MHKLSLAPQPSGCQMRLHGCRSALQRLSPVALGASRAQVTFRARGRTVPKACYGTSSGQGASEASGTKSVQEQAPFSWPSPISVQVAIGRKISSESGLVRADGPMGHSGPPEANAVIVNEEVLRRLDALIAALARDSPGALDPAPAAWQQLGSLQAEVSELRRLARAGRRQILRLEGDVGKLARLKGQVREHNGRLQALEERVVEEKVEFVVVEEEEAVAHLGKELEGREIVIGEQAATIRELHQELEKRESRIGELEAEAEQQNKLLRSLLAGPTSDRKFELGDIVRVMRVSAEVARAVQQGEGCGHWDPYMERLLGETAIVLGYHSGGMVRVLMDVGDDRGEPVRWDPRLLQLVIRRGDSSGLPQGTRVCIRGVSVEEAKRLQSDWQHGGWHPERARMLGKTGVVVQVFINGGMRVTMDDGGGTYPWHRELVVPVA